MLIRKRMCTANVWLKPTLAVYFYGNMRQFLLRMVEYRVVEIGIYNILIKISLIRGKDYKNEEYISYKLHRADFFKPNKR